MLMGGMIRGGGRRLGIGSRGLKLGGLWRGFGNGEGEVGSVLY